MLFTEAYHLDDSLYLSAVISNRESMEAQVLKKTPGIFSLAHPHQDMQFEADHPFFFQDYERTFSIVPQELSILFWPFLSIGKIDPAIINAASKAYYNDLEILPINPVEPIPNLKSHHLFEPSFPAASESDPTVFVRNEMPGVASLKDNDKDDSLAQTTDTISKIASAKLHLDLRNEDITFQGIAIPIILKRYHFRTFYHPYMCAFISELNKNGLGGLLPGEYSGQSSLFLAWKTLWRAS